MIREQLLGAGLKDGVPLHMFTAFLGGTIAVTLCAPVDVVKSRIQSSRKAGVVSLSDVASALALMPSDNLQRGAEITENGRTVGVLQRMVARLVEDDSHNYAHFCIFRAAQEDLLAYIIDMHVHISFMVISMHSLHSQS